MQAEVINLLPVATEAASANFAFQLTAVFVLWIFSQSAVFPPRAFTPSTKVFIMRLAVYFKNPSVTLTSHHVHQRSSRISKALWERWEQTFGTVTKDVMWYQSDSCGLFEWVLVKFSREAQFCFSLLSLIKSHSWRQMLSSQNSDCDYWKLLPKQERRKPLMFYSSLRCPALFGSNGGRNSCQCCRPQ